MPSTVVNALPPGLTHGATQRGRDVLVGTLGMAGFAALMDAFSRLERTLNRAWSAAADGVLDEAQRCVDEAVALAPEVERRLARRDGAV